MTPKEWDIRIKQERENKDETHDWEREKRRYQMPENKDETKKWEKEKEKEKKKE